MNKRRRGRSAGNDWKPYLDILKTLKNLWNIAKNCAKMLISRKSFIGKLAE